MDWSLLYKAPLWALTRPQQMVFQGAKSGAQNYERTTARYQNEGINPILANLLGLRESMSGASKGIASALNPWGEDVSGEDITEGMSKSSLINKIAGLGLDLVADPLNAPIGIAGKTAGTMARTAPNLMRIKQAGKLGKTAELYDPATANVMANELDDVRQLLESLPGGPGQAFRTTRNIHKIKQQQDRERAWKALDNLGWKKWLLDIPVAPKEAEPVAIRHPEAIVTRLVSEMLPNRGPKGLIGGAYSPYDNLLFYNKPLQYEVLPHEMVHWASSRPDYYDETKAALEQLAKMNPTEAQKLKTNYTLYDELPPAKLGEELLAMYTGGRYSFRGLKVPNHFAINSLLKRQQEAIQPEHYMDPIRVPIEAIYNLAKTRERY